MHIVYRNYATADNLLLSELDKASASPELARYSSAHGVFENIQADFLEGGGAFWVAEDLDTERLVGCIGLKVSLDTIKTGKIKALRVDPPYHRQGIATTLLSMLEEYACSQGLKKLVLGVDETAKPALMLYEKAGFKHISSRPLPGDGHARGYEKALD